MKKNSLILLSICAIFFLSCKTEESQQQDRVDPALIDDTQYTINKNFKKGDVRRYGIFADQKVNQSYLKNVLDLAEKGLEMNFPSGLYQTPLHIKGRKNVSLSFEDASFSGQIQISENSENIQLRGKVTSYNKFFSRASQKIKIDTLIIASDTLKNRFGKRSLGCNIYAGTKDISIKKLVVEDLGSGEPYYQFAIAALQIHGWKNNPEKVYIDEAIIEKSDRHGAYITGSYHSIKNLTVNQVGLGTIQYNNGLEDAENVEVKDITSVWLNRCQDSDFEQININLKNSKPTYSIHFDEGVSSQPTTINYLVIKNNENSIPMLPRDLTNVVVRHIERNPK